MAKLKTNDLFPDFLYSTPYETDLNISETIKKADKTAILFLRYYGCPVCQLDLHELKENYFDLTDENTQLLVVLQSDPNNLKISLEKEPFPFTIICDPQQQLYHMLEIEPAKSMAKMVNANALLKIAKAKSAGYKHGEYEGNELQLPATFIVNTNRMITYSHYGKSVADIPDIPQLKKLLSSK